MKRFKIETFKGRGTQPYYYHVKAANGRIVEVPGEGYKTPGNRNRAVAKIAARYRSTGNAEVKVVDLPDDPTVKK